MRDGACGHLEEKVRDAGKARCTQRAYLALGVLNEVVAIELVGGHRANALAERSVADLRGQAVLKVEKARLAHILELGASLADLGLLVSTIVARLPAEDGEWSRARLALLI